MKETFNYEKIPHNYTLCLMNKCKQADSCLRQLAEQAMPDHVLTCKIIHPKHLKVSNDVCSHYRPNTKVHYAKGFLNILGGIPYKDSRKIIDNLKNHYGYRSYYRMRKGERTLSPEEQQHFRSLLKTYGFPKIQEFDSYEEEYLW